MPGRGAKQGKSMRSRGAGRGRRGGRASKGGGAGPNNRVAMAATRFGRDPAGDMLREIPIFPPVKLVRGMLYFEADISLSGTSGAQSSYVFSANDAFDPNRTGSGHQPIGFDQMMSVYNQFTVISSSISVTAVNGLATTTRVGVSLIPSATAVTNITQRVENGLGKMGLLLGAKQPGQHCVQRMVLKCDVAKYFGVNGMQGFVQNPSFLGNAATSPTEGVFFQIQAWDLMLTETYSVAADVLVSYDVVFWEPKQLGTSVSKPFSQMSPAERADRFKSEGRKRHDTRFLTVEDQKGFFDHVVSVVEQKFLALGLSDKSGVRVRVPDSPVLVGVVPPEEDNQLVKFAVDRDWDRPGKWEESK